ncbi:putative entry exclusion protein TrbK-alt [Novosphingobium capsulatum]|uniref:putative entry exclusion protein TrbK-alt n=1 Tax=Novosphingobium capsulatum TaxID=13688 RepID=UPI000786C8BE|nr:putative entry exclusion protein TrbK-alt [Novosphingobium capsulatum]WQD94652.1 putative entry exclusion protein TrbK-alt [Novosphingobium capsulatum]
MDGKTLARIGAIIFVALAITATAIEMNRPTEQPDDPVTLAQPAPARDPLRVELARCGAMGEAGGRDPSCLHAWAENRRRFLGQPAPASPVPTAPTPSTPDQNGSR